MDVNNTAYFLFKGEEDFEHGSSRFAWDVRRQALTLDQAQLLRLPYADPSHALDRRRQASPVVMDRFGQIARIHGDGAVLEYNAGKGYFTLRDGELRDVAAPAGKFVDLAIGGDGRLAAAYTDGAQHGLLVFHLGRRWQSDTGLPEAPVAVQVDQDNHIWCASDRLLMLCRGEPLPHPYTPASERFEPLQVTPEPLHLVWQQDLPGGLKVLALKADAGRLYLLAYDDAFGQQILVRERSLLAGKPWRGYGFEEDMPFATDLAVLPAGRLAAISAREPADTQFEKRDCPVLRLAQDPKTGADRAVLVHERYPMVSQAAPRFVGGLDEQVRYQAEAGLDTPAFTPRPRGLHPLLRPRYHTAARVTLRRELDSGEPDTVWHRLYLDACIPPECNLRVWVKTYNDPAQRGQASFLEQPAPLWSPLVSELPFHEGAVASRRGESGLFEILLQRGNGNVRRVSGRYLVLRLEMTGDGRHTPSLHAMRVYYPRFSYQESYLPDYLHQEEPFQQPPSGVQVAANGADVRERFLATLEGMLTPIEGTVAAAEQLIHPESTPPENLPWLAETLGLELPAYWPVARRRALLDAAGLLQRWRGTYRGVCLALDIATDGGVRRGQVVVVENFRLRRTMATILGIDMDDRDHPLTLGTGMSGNSIVGDSLILSEEDARTFLALFAPELASVEEREAVKSFFDRYSHQTSVLLHGQGRSQRDLVEEVLRQQIPAHLRWKIIETDHPFVLGLAPLLAVDSFLETRPPPRPVTLDDTYLGREGILRNPLAFSPRDVNARPGA